MSGAGLIYIKAIARRDEEWDSIAESTMRDTENLHKSMNRIERESYTNLT